MLRALLLALACLASFGVALASQQDPASVRGVSPPELGAARGYDKGNSQSGGPAPVVPFRVHGVNSGCSTSFEAIANASSTAVFLTAADEIRVKSGGNAADIYGGNGAQEITVEGINDSWDATTVVIQTAGASASAKTTDKFFRVNKAYVSKGGTYTITGVPTAAVVIETEAGTALATIGANVGQAEQAVYTVPDGYTGYILGWGYSYDPAVPLSIKLWTRSDADDSTAPMGAMRVRFDSLAALVPAQTPAAGSQYPAQPVTRDVRPPAPIAIPARTDVWLTCSTTVGTTGIADGYFDIYLVPEPAPSPTPTPIPSPTPTPT